jgi:hypothetical protein
MSGRLYWEIAGDDMNYEYDLNMLEEIARLEFNNQAMGLIAEQCRAMKKDGEANILGDYIRVNEARLAHLRNDHGNGSHLNKNVRRNPEERGNRRWGLIDRMGSLLLG